MLALIISAMLLGQQDPSVLTVPMAHASALTTDELKAMATEIAKEHHLNVNRFLKTIECESNWDVYAKGDYVKGEPTSFGLAQLHYPTRDWGVATSTAYEPRFALETMAKKWENGEQRRWSCWSALYD